MITDNEELRIKLNEIIDWILKMCHQIYKLRPTCTELLSEYNQWSIEWNEVTSLVICEKQIDLEQISQHKFFNNFLTAKTSSGD